MVYSDTTNKNGLLQHGEYLTGLGDGGISGSATLKAQFTAALNRASQRVFAWLLQRNDSWDIDDTNHGDYPILTTPLTTNRDYSIPVSEKVLKIKDLYVTYDGTNWNRAILFDNAASNIPMGNDTETDSMFSINEPRYDVKYGSIFLYPKGTSAQVTAGGSLRIEWTRELDEFTTSDTTQEPGWLDEGFQPILSALASYEWAIVNAPALAQGIKALIISFGFNPDEQNMANYYGSKAKDERLTFKMNLPWYE